METPKNCWECEHAHSCRSYYGGSLCKHSKEINQAAIAAMLNNKKEEKHHGN